MQNCSDEAKALYKQLTRHPQAYLNKRAKQMIFGLDAMDNLKTHTMSYSAGSSAFETFFTKLSGDYNLGYKRPDSPPQNDTLTIVLITAIMVGPLALLAGKIFLK